MIRLDRLAWLPYQWRQHQGEGEDAGHQDGFTKEELDKVVKDAVEAFLRAYLPRG